MAEQVLEAAETGLGTIKSAGASIASSALPSLPATAKHVVINVVSGTLYIENDGTAADANALAVVTGASVTVKNSRTMLEAMRIFADAAYDARFSYSY